MAKDLHKHFAVGVTTAAYAKGRHSRLTRWKPKTSEQLIINHYIKNERPIRKKR